MRPPEPFLPARTGAAARRRAGRRATSVAAGAALTAGVLLLTAAPGAAEPAGSTQRERSPSEAVRTASTAAFTTSAPRPARRADEPDLAVEIDTLSPSYLPERGTVRVSGTLTNRSDERYTAINLHVFIGDTPITSQAQLAEERERDPEEPVGDRVTEPGTFDTVASLAPGRSTRFSMDVPRRELAPVAPGVYWFGVHALGDSSVPRDGFADGRARTFISVVPPRADEPVPTALVIPIRHPVRHTEDGRVEDVDGWAETLGDGGSLRSLVDFGASAGDRSVTWLVDPSVVDTVGALVDGNLPRSLEDSPETDQPDADGDGSPDPSAETQPTEPDESPTDGEGDEEGPEPPPENAATEPGTEWLARFGAAAEGDQVLVLPYGDTDVAAAAQQDPSAYRAARRRSGDVLQPYGLPADPAVGSPTGLLDPASIDAIARGTTILVSDQMFRGPAPSSARVAGRRLTVTSANAAAGGPGPNERWSSLAMRQQILAEAALRLDEGRPEPLTVVLPPGWRPDGNPSFFSGLDVDWVRLSSVSGLGDDRGPVVQPRDLAYPTRQVVRELDAANFSSAHELTRLGRLLEEVLARNDQVAGVVRDEALTSLSYASRVYPNGARAATDRSSRWIDDQLASIRVQAPPAVTLSSNSGKFSATVVNGLDHAVQVRLESVADSPLRISDTEPMEIPARGRTSVLLDAVSPRLGVHNVELLVTSENGRPLGSSDTLPIRSNQVSDVIWLILGTGVALLFGAILVRLVRRLRGRRA